MHLSKKLLLLAVTALLGLLVANHFMASSTYQAEPLDLTKYCLLSKQACQQGEISMSIDRNLVNPLTPTQLTVTWPNNNASSLMLTLQGVEMDMGVVKYALTANDQGVYQANIMMPSCSSGDMTWAGEITDGIEHAYMALKVTK